MKQIAGIFTGIAVAIAALIAARGILLDMYRFDLSVLAHWKYLASVLMHWWGSGSGPKVEFILAIIASIVVPVIAIWAAWKLHESVASVWWFGLRAIAVVLACSWRFILKPAARVVAACTIALLNHVSGAPRFGRKAEEPLPMPQVKFGAVDPGVNSPGASSERNDPRDIDRTGKAKPSAAQIAATKPEAVQPPPVTSDNEMPARHPAKTGLDFSAEDDAEDDDDASPIQSAAPALPGEGQDVTLKDTIAMLHHAALWLSARGWEIQEMIPVNAMLEGNFLPEIDRFDNDPRAAIPLLAWSDIEIRPCVPADLQGRVWRATPWEDERSGIPVWHDEADPTVTMPCPVTIAMRAAARFGDAFEGGLSHLGGYSREQIYPAVILANGDVVNWDELVDSWSERGSIAHLERPGAMELAFTEDKVEGKVSAMVLSLVRKAAEDEAKRQAA
jgi:hypothetical protein